MVIRTRAGIFGRAQTSPGSQKAPQEELVRYDKYFTGTKMHNGVYGKWNGVILILKQLIGNMNSLV